MKHLTFKEIEAGMEIFRQDFSLISCVRRLYPSVQKRAEKNRKRKVSQVPLEGEKNKVSLTSNGISSSRDTET